MAVFWENDVDKKKVTENHKVLHIVFGAGANLAGCVVVVMGKLTC